MSKQPIHVLLVEDNPGDARFVREMVRKVPNLSIHHVERLAAAVDYLANHNVDVIMLDLGLPDSQGLETVRAVIKTGCAVPVVVLTGQDDEAMGQAAVREGAQDYLIKGQVVGNMVVRAMLYAMERKRAERELQESKHLIESVVENVPLMIFLKEAEDLRFVVFNRAGEDLLGHDRNDLLGKNNLDLFPPEQAAFFMAKDREVLAQGGMLDIPEEPIQTAKKGERLLHTRKICIKGSDGVTKYLLGISEDITERKRAENDLEASETRYRRLFEAAKDGILILDAETGKIVDVNPFMTELTGYSKEDFVGLHLWDIGPFRDAAASKNSFTELQANEYVRHDDLPLLAKDGRKIAVEFVSNVYQVGLRKVIQCNIRDVSARNRAEAERVKLEEQLRMSQKMEAIGSLAGGVAHDFNNLLSVILSYTGVAMEELREGEPLREDLLEVKNAAERAVALTRQLLAFSRKQVLQPEHLNLNQIVAGTSKMLRRILGEDIDLVEALAPDLGLTLADPGQIEQVLMNLVVNARDAMPQGGKLMIETSNVEIDEEYAARHVAVKPGPYVLLAVSDTGCGMDEQTRERIFEPFFTTKEMSKGTGLGLSTVYGIVKQSGGNVWVYSELGQGTTFKIYLPRDLAATLVSPIRPPTIPVQTTGTETILVVEDEQVLLKIAKRTLEAAGYTVLTAQDGEDALRTCAMHTGKIHLLLTDVVMPLMSGRALAQELVKTRPDLKVLYMSGYTDDAIVHHGVIEAGTHFLGKPFTMADLKRKIREVLEQDISSPVDGRAQAANSEIEEKTQLLYKDALRLLPSKVLGKLRKAVVAARYDEIVELIETIRDTQPDVATGLRRMVDQFDYDELQKLLGE